MLGGSQSPWSFSPGNSKEEPPPCSVRPVQRHSLACRSKGSWGAHAVGVLSGALLWAHGGAGPNHGGSPACSHVPLSYLTSPSVCLLSVQISCGGGSERSLQQWSGVAVLPPGCSV